MKTTTIEQVQRKEIIIEHIRLPNGKYLVPTKYPVLRLIKDGNSTWSTECFDLCIKRLEAATEEQLLDTIEATIIALWEALLPSEYSFSDYGIAVRTAFFQKWSEVNACPTIRHDSHLFEYLNKSEYDAMSTAFWGVVGDVAVDNKLEVAKLLIMEGRFNVETAKQLRTIIDRVSQSCLDTDKVVVCARYDHVCCCHKVFVNVHAKKYCRERLDKMRSAFADLWTNDADFGLFAIDTEFDE